MSIEKLFQEFSSKKDEGTLKRLLKDPKPFEYLGIKMGDIRAFGQKLPMSNLDAKAWFELNYFETKLLSTLLVDPKTVDPNLVLTWIEGAYQSVIIDQGISHFFFDVPNYQELLSTLSDSLSPNLEYGFFSLLSTYFRQAPLDEIDIKLSLTWLDRISNTIIDKPLTIQNAMNNAVVMAGLHVPKLVKKAYEVAAKIGYILPLKAKNSCNIQSATDYLIRYKDNAKYSRVAKIHQS